MNYWKNKKVLVTGGCGFIGSHLVGKLLEKGATVTVFDNLSNSIIANLGSHRRNCEVVQGDCRDMSKAEKICNKKDIVMNLAAKVSGVDYNMVHPGTMLSENVLIETVMTEAARRAAIDKFLVVSSAVVYPEDVIVPTPESEGFRGEPEKANSGYGWAKRVAELLGRYYNEEFGMKIAVVRPYNCYGPKDHFFPKPIHVIPSLIRRVVDGENPVVVWGSGKQTRAFLYVEDLVRGMMLAVEKYSGPDPINLGTDEEATMSELVESIIQISGRTVSIKYDRSKPDGSMRRNSDNTLAKKNIGFVAQTPLKTGLQKTIEWYMKSLRQKLP